MKKITKKVEEPEVTIETLEVGQPVCKHQNQGEGKCFDCGKSI